MKTPRKIAVALCLLAALLSGAYFVWWKQSLTCLDLADRNAPAAMLRAATTADAGGGQELCEGLALLAEKKAGPARQKLAVAAKAANDQDRWSIQGYLARALAFGDQTDLALQNWDEAIEGAVRAKNIDRQNIFRTDRGVLLAMRKQFGPALADFETVYRQTSYDTVRSAVAHLALKVSVSGENLAAATRWYPLSMQAAQAIGDAETIAHGTEYFGQMLDDREQFDASAKVYQQGVDTIEGTGSKFLHGELLEFQAQSRFAAGDYRGGERAYGQAAELFRQAGRVEYAVYLENNLKAKQGRFESGGSCSTLLEQGSYEAAEKAVSDIPEDRRSFQAKVCLVQALNLQGDTARARSVLDELVAETEPGGWPCNELQAISRQIGVTPASHDAIPSPPMPLQQIESLQCGR